MKISIIIVTYNRGEELNECLNLILFQTTLPDEIIVVDNGDNSELGNLIKNKKEDFRKHNIPLKYIENKRENSLTVARNIGIQNAGGDIILFLDDDVVVDKDYLKEIVKVYERYPNALGVQGYIYITKKKTLKIINLISKIFFLSYLKEDECRVLPSISSIYPYPLNRIIPCEWLSGANHSYRRSILEQFKYDENLKKWSQGEDIDLSYRVFKRYHSSLYITPYAKLIHKVSPKGRMPQKQLSDMCEIYELYLFYKMFDQNFKNKLIYFMSRIGKLFFAVGRFLSKLSKIELIRIGHLLESSIYCIKHLDEIKKGDLEFFNKRISLKRNKS
jgi:GT2 family glycosyltransferase